MSWDCLCLRIELNSCRVPERNNPRYGQGATGSRDHDPPPSAPQAMTGVPRFLVIERVLFQHSTHASDDPQWHRGPTSYSVWAARRPDALVRLRLTLHLSSLQFLSYALRRRLIFPQMPWVSLPLPFPYFTKTHPHHHLLLSFLPRDPLNTLQPSFEFWFLLFL